jgi:hypothetical protein
LDQQTPGLRSQKLLLADPVEPELPVEPLDVEPLDVPPPIAAPPLPLLVAALEALPGVAAVPLEAPVPDDVPLDAVEPDEVVVPDDGLVGVVASGVVASAVVSTAGSSTDAAWPVGGTRSGRDAGSGATCVLPLQPATVNVSTATTMEARSRSIRFSLRVPPCDDRMWGTR